MSENQFQLQTNLLRLEHRLEQRLRTVAIVGAQGVGVVCRTAALAIAARTIGAEGIGFVATVIAFASFGALAAGLGLPNAAIHFLPSYLAAGNTADRQSFIAFGQRSVSLASAGLLILAALAFAITRHSGADQPEVTLLAAVMGAALASANFRAEVLKADDFALSGILVMQVVQPVTLVAFVGACFVADAPWQWVAGSFAGAATVAYATLQLISPTRRPLHAPQPGAHKTWLKFSGPLALSGLSLLLLAQLPVIVVGWSADVEQAGGYAIAYRMSSIPVLITAATNASFGPGIVHRIREGNSDQALGYYAQLLRINIAIVLVTTAAMVLGGRLLLSGLYGSEFEEFYSTLVVLAIGLAISSSVGPAAYLLTALGRNWAVAITYLAVGLCAVPATALCSQRSGANGAAWAIAAGMALQTIVQSVLLWRTWKSGISE